MTKRERQFVVATLGAVGFAISVVGTADFLITGRMYPALMVLFVLVALGGAPCILPAIWEELNSHRLPSKKPSDPDEPIR